MDKVILACITSTIKRIQSEKREEGGSQGSSSILGPFYVEFVGRK